MSFTLVDFCIAVMALSILAGTAPIHSLSEYLLSVFFVTGIALGLGGSISEQKQSWPFCILTVVVVTQIYTCDKTA